MRRNTPGIWCWLRMARNASTAVAAERAADLSRSRGAPETAAELAEASIRLTPSELVVNIRRRRIAAGYHRVTAGEMSCGREHMTAALADAPDGRNARTCCGAWRC